MREEIRQHILNLLDKVIKSIKQKDTDELREISNMIIHSASIYQDDYSTGFAVVIYALSKILERDERVEPKIIYMLKKTKTSLEKNNIRKYENNMKKVVKVIGETDKKLDIYVRKVINDARIKKGSRIYEHGISLAQTADILGITQWELMKYIGKTKIQDTFIEGIDVKQRIDYARRLFNA